MKRYSIYELVEEKTFGFINEKSDKDFFDALQPIENVEKQIHDFNKRDLVILESASYTSSFLFDKIKSLSSIFKNCPMYLANCTSESSKKTDSHLLIFSLGRGYYALFTPFLKINKGESEYETRL